MSLSDDVVYFQLLAVSLLAAPLLPRLPQACRAFCSCLLGMLLVLSVCGLQTLHSLCLVLLTLTVVRVVSRRHVHTAAFLCCFGYLAFFRSAHLLLPSYFDRYRPHANAAQLFMTLRCIGLAFELHDDASIPVNLCSMFAYLYNFVGIFGGPYYRYRSFLHACTAPHPPFDIGPLIYSKVQAIALYITVAVGLQRYFSDQALRSPAFYSENCVFGRILYACPVFVVLRMRVYVAWTFGEACCVAAGVGEESRSQPDAPRKHLVNVDVSGCELDPSFRAGMRAWNRSVQSWLVNVTYRRTSRTWRTPYTMLVSAFWHGIHPGYYLSFLTVPLCLAAEDALHKVHSGSHTWWWFFRMRGFEYMAMGFLLLDGTSTLQYWSNVYYWLHISCVVVWVYAKIAKYISIRKSRNEEITSDE